MSLPPICVVSLNGCEYIPMNQLGASTRSSPRGVLTLVYRGKIAPCSISMSSPNMNILPYIGDESGSQLVPDPSRLMGSARSMDECIPICIAWPSCEGGCFSPAAPELCEGGCSCIE